MSLNDSNYDVTESECPECEDGELWVNSFELVCEDCETVFRKANNSSSFDTADYFAKYLAQRGETENDEYRYSNSGVVILPGGFSEAYHGDGIYGSGHDEDEIADSRRRY